MCKRVLSKAVCLTVSACLLAVLYAGFSSDSLSSGITVTYVTPTVTVADAETNLDNKTVSDLTKTDSESDSSYDIDNTEYVPTTEDKLLAMLNRNYCYGDAFANDNRIADAITVSLYDYSNDLPGYGICVDKTLISGFAQDFYGKELKLDAIHFEEMPEGYYPAPIYEVGTQYHSIISVTKTEVGHNVQSKVIFYYGGSDLDAYIVDSVFVENIDSPFGFHLISCTIR